MAQEQLPKTDITEWIRVRAEGDEDASALVLASAGDWANKPASAFTIPKSGDGTTRWNSAQFIISGGAADGKTFSWKMYVYDLNGPARLAAYGTGILGSQAVVKYPDTEVAATNKFWADTLVITAQSWPKTIKVGTDGLNTPQFIALDLLGAQAVYFEFADADGTTGTEAGDLSVYGRGF